MPIVTAMNNHVTRVTPLAARTVRLRDLLALALLAAWLLLGAWGAARTLAADFVPGETGAMPTRWPADAGLPGPDGRPLLLVFLHPQCPCSRATLDELARLLAETEGAPRVLVPVLEPRSAAGSWLDTDVVRQARGLSGVEVVPDPDGRLASRFGVLTSGQALLYGRDSKLLYAGGLTPGRGHEGQSPGRVAVADLLAGRAPAVRSAPVFGCALRAEAPPTGGGGAP